MPLGDTGAGPDGGPNTGYGGQDSFGSGAGNDGRGGFGGGGALAGAPSLGYGAVKDSLAGRIAGSIIGGGLLGPLGSLAGGYLGNRYGGGLFDSIGSAFSGMGGAGGGGGWSPESGSDSRHGGQYSTPYYNYFAGPRTNGTGGGLYRDWSQQMGQPGQAPTPPAYQNTAPIPVAPPQFAAPPQFPQQPPQQGGGLGLPMAPIGYQNDSPSVGAGMSPMAGGTPPPGLLALLSRLQAGGQQPPPQPPAGLMGGNQWA